MFSVNGNQTTFTSPVPKLNIGDPDLTSLNRKISSENYLRRDDYSKASSGLTRKDSTFTFSKLGFPKKKIISQIDLNTAEEIQLIEENVRINNILARHTWSSDSLLSDDDLDKPVSIQESDDELYFRRITSEYPLLTLHTPSDGSLVAVIDFDISDELPGCSNREEACSSGYKK